MTWNEILSSLRSILDIKLFSIGETTITLSTVVTLILLMLAAAWISRSLSKAAAALVLRRGGREGTAGTIGGLIHYTGLTTGFAVALQTAGIDLTALFAAGAIFAIGLGFAMQSIAQNFVAGFILLTERAIKPGDILEVEGRVVKVLDMGIRATIARTRDGEDLVIPNSVLIQSTVKNYTLKDAVYRIRVLVGVVYSSDMKQVRRILETVAAEISERWAVEGSQPQVLLTAFGSSSVDFEVAIWMSDPWRSRPAISELHEAIWWAFQNAGIIIAFPQIDVHFDPALTDGLRRLGNPAA